MAKVAILILNFNGEDHLRRFLPSIIANSPDCDIMVGDNGSTDHSLQLLEDSFNTVSVIRLDKNYGYAEGYNQLISQVDYEFLALVNSDVEATENWTEGLIGLLESDPKIAAVQPKILSYSQRNKFEYAGAAGGYLDRYGYPFCRGRIFKTIEEDFGQYDDNREVFWASGACFMLRKSVFDELDGFDGDFFAHMEEIDLNWRMHNAGYKVMYCSESRVYHLGGGTLGYNNPQKTYLNFRNSWRMLLKNLPVQNRISTLFIRWWLDMASIIFFLIQFQLKNSIAVIRAHIYISVNLKKILRKNQSRDNKELSAEIVPLKSSLVWQYYIKRKKTFSKLIPKGTPPTT